jgi:serine/threonine protein kinase
LPKIPEHFSSDLWTLLKQMIQVNPRKRPNCEQMIDHPIFRKRSAKYFPEFEEEDYDGNNNSQSFLLKTIRMPKNIMHLSSRLPQKNYDSSLDGGYNSEERRYQGGSNFKG